MLRFLAGGAAALLMVAAGLMLGRSMAGTDARIPPPPAPAAEDVAATPMTFAETAGVPTATELSKEEKRFNRYDKDKNGAVSREEYLQSRRKAYAKLDINGDGVLSFDEYAVKAVTKFAKADADKSSGLNRSEFSTTRVVRKNKPKPKCPPAAKGPVLLAPQDAPEEPDDA